MKAEVVVIGMGPGGEDVAGRLAEAGLDVVGIENELVGGECPYWGCIPSKMAVRAASLIAETRRVVGMAGTSTVTPDWGPVAARIRDEATDDWDDRVAVERFESKGGRFIRGKGRITAPGQVAVGDRELDVSKAIVVASGTKPFIPPIAGLSDIPYWTNREALAAKEIPTSVVILGGGAIGLELGQVFSRFGSRVTIVEALDHLLPLDEPEAGAILAGVLVEEGVDVRVGVRAQRVERKGGNYSVQLEDGSSVTGEQVLVATGRRPDLKSVGLDTVGIPPDAPAAPVDEHLKVASGVWAVGDVTGKGAFTHVAMYQSRIAAADILGEPHEPADYRALPRVTFTDPEVGSVGMTEAEARRAGLDVRVRLAAVPSSARGWIHKAGNEGTVKLVADVGRNILVGGMVAGPSGGEVMAFIALAVHAEVPLPKLQEMIYAYPTFHRAIEDALKGLEP